MNMVFKDKKVIIELTPPGFFNSTYELKSLMTERVGKNDGILVDMKKSILILDSNVFIKSKGAVLDKV
ncbi:hypothetical protein AB6G19_01990 [Providencia manganoxydans]